MNHYNYFYYDIGFFFTDDQKFFGPRLCSMATASVKKSIVYLGLDERRLDVVVQTYAKNKGTDQPAHSRSLINAFLFAFWEVL